jgi:hypothetical protein
MKVNVGSLDRVVRTAVGMGLIGAALAGFATGTFKWVALGLGSITAIVGLSGTCPVYSIFGISTCSMKKS